MLTRIILVFLFGYFCVGLGIPYAKGDAYTLTIRMPDVTSDKADALICTAAQLDPEEAYIERFIIHASMKVAHHMSLYGCQNITNSEPSWKCGRDAYICCGRDDQIIYAWANDATGRIFPEGVGFRVGGGTGTNYLVVQMHYAKPFAPGQTDNSGYTVNLVRGRPIQQVGMIILANWGQIPPHNPNYNMDCACVNTLNYTVYTLAYRTHAHNLAILISGYRVRDNNWVEIGRNSPVLPQAFYNTTYSGLSIKPGDILASRCVMDSESRNEVTKIGPKNHDEMCNFYIMYSTYYQGNVRNYICFQNTKNGTIVTDYPPESESLDGIKNAEIVKEKFGLE